MSLREAAATSRSAAARCWPPPRRCPITRSTPSGSGTPASASRTRTWSARRCKARLQLIKEHPKDALAQKALFRVAAGYHQLAYYSKAAEYYEDFANKFPGEKKATDALGNATTFRIGLGESDKAIADMDSFVKFYGTRKPQDAAGVFFQMGEVYEKDKKYDELARHLDELPQEVGRRRAVPTARSWRTTAWARWPGRRPARRRPRTAPASRSSASPRPAARRSSTTSTRSGRRARRSRRRSGRSAGRPPARRSSVFDRNKRTAAKAPGALPDRAEDLEQGRSRLEDHGQGRRDARGPGGLRGRRRRPSTWPRRSTRTSSASSSPRASTSSSRASTTPRRRPRRRRRRPRSR